MNDKPFGNRRVFHWMGLNRAADIEAMTAAIAETVAGLCNRDGSIARLNEDGSLDQINLPTFRTLVSSRLCGMRVVRGDNGVQWKREFYSFDFEPKPPPGPRTKEMGLPTATRSDGPDAAVLREVYEQLPLRLPRVVE